MTNKIKNHYYFDTRKGIFRPFLVSKIRKTSNPSQNHSFIYPLPRILFLLNVMPPIVYSNSILLDRKNYWCIPWHLQSGNKKRHTAPIWIEKKKRGGSSSLLRNIHTITRNGIQAIPGISKKSSINKARQGAFHIFLDHT